MLKNRQDFIAYREESIKAYGAQAEKIIVCEGTGCVAGGSLKIYDRLKELMSEKGLHVAVELEVDPHDESVGLKKSGCHGFCEMGPLVRIDPQGWLYTKVKLDDCEEIVEKTICKGEHIERLAYKKCDCVYKKQDEIPFYAGQTRVVLEHCGKIDADSIREYIAIGGYSALEKALFEMDADGIVSEISESGLRGRGGGGFPAGRKWEQVKRQKVTPKYVVCNGDEGDPGAFMDRSIMEGDPHRMLEGMIIAGFACGAEEGYIYVRAEYPLAVKRLKTAIAQAEELGLLDKPFHLWELLRGVSLRHIVSAVPPDKAEESEQIEQAEQSKQTEQTEQEEPTLDAKTRFYIPEDKKIRAQMRFEQKGNGVKALVITCVLSVILCVVLFKVLPFAYTAISNFGK